MIEVFNVRIYDEPSVLIDMLKEFGFRDVRMIKAFDRAVKAEPGDASIVYECRK